MFGTTVPNTARGNQDKSPMKSARSKSAAKQPQTARKNQSPLKAARPATSPTKKSDDKSSRKPAIPKQKTGKSVKKSKKAPKDDDFHDFGVKPFEKKTKTKNIAAVEQRNDALLNAKVTVDEAEILLQ